MDSASDPTSLHEVAQKVEKDNLHCILPFPPCATFPVALRLQSVQNVRGSKMLFGVFIVCQKRSIPLFYRGFFAQKFAIAVCSRTSF